MQATYAPEFVTLVSSLILVLRGLNTQPYTSQGSATKLKKLNKHSETHYLLTTELISKSSFHISNKDKCIAAYKHTSTHEILT